MNPAFAAFIVLLFVVLTPGVLLRLPPKGSKYVVAAVHGLVFAFVLCFAYKNYFIYQEGMEEHVATPMDSKKKLVEKMSRKARK
jgi:hypothetical protein